MSYSMRARIEITYILSYRVRLRQQRNTDLREHIYVRNISSIIARLEISRGQILSTGF